MDKCLFICLHGIPGRLVKLRTFKQEYNKSGNLKRVSKFIRTTFTGSQAWGETESIFRTRMDVLTFVMGRKEMTGAA
jgi:hypothetical protein